MFLAQQLYSSFFSYDRGGANGNARMRQEEHDFYGGFILTH